MSDEASFRPRAMLTVWSGAGDQPVNSHRYLDDAVYCGTASILFASPLEHAHWMGRILQT